jgi:GT2 family glycosyltransferase
MKEDVTLIIPARGRGSLTKRLIASLMKAKAEYEILLVDDASPTPLANAIGDVPQLRLKIIRNKKQVGPSASRNIGIMNSHTRFIAFTDNDVVVTKKWMPLLYNHLINAPNDVAGIGGQVIDDGQNLIGNYSTCLGLLNPYIMQGRAMYLVTANCLFRREVLLKVGCFDESFRIPGGEDPEMSFRLLKAGYRLEYLPDAHVIHHYNASWSRFYNLFKRYGFGCRKAMQTLCSS